MKGSTFAAIVAQAAIASAAGPDPNAHHGGWHGGPMNVWGGGPGCAETCYSSYWQTVSPTPSAYCGAEAASVDGCITAACASATSDLNVFNSVSASVCNVLTACGTVGTYTYTYTTPPGGSRPPRFGQATATFATAPVTVTGCPWNGGEVGWGWWGPGTGVAGTDTVVGGETTVIGGSTSVIGGSTSVIDGTTTVIDGTATVVGGLTTVVGGETTVVGGLTTLATPTSIWGEFGSGWSYTTWTTPETSTLIIGTSQITETGEATIAEAISGLSTVLTTLGTSTSLAAAAPTGSSNMGVKVMGVALGAVLAGAGMM